MSGPQNSSMKPKYAGWQDLPVEIVDKILKMGMFQEREEVVEYTACPMLEVNYFGIDPRTRHLACTTLRNTTFIDLYLRNCRFHGGTPPAVAAMMKQQYTQTRLLSWMVNIHSTSASVLDVEVQCTKHCREQQSTFHVRFPVTDLTLLDLASHVSHRAHRLRATSYIRFRLLKQGTRHSRRLQDHIVQIMSLLRGYNNIQFSIWSLHLEPRPITRLRRTMLIQTPTQFLDWADTYLQLITNQLRAGTQPHHLLTILFNATDQYHHALSPHRFHTFTQQESLHTGHISRILRLLLTTATAQHLLLLPSTSRKQTRHLYLGIGFDRIATYTDHDDPQYLANPHYPPRNEPGVPHRRDLLSTLMLRQRAYLALAQARAATNFAVRRNIFRSVYYTLGVIRAGHAVVRGVRRLWRMVRMAYLPTFVHIPVAAAAPTPAAAAAVAQTQAQPQPQPQQQPAPPIPPAPQILPPPPDLTYFTDPSRPMAPWEFHGPHHSTAAAHSCLALLQARSTCDGDAATVERWTAEVREVQGRVDRALGMYWARWGPVLRGPVELGGGCLI